MYKYRDIFAYSLEYTRYFRGYVHKIRIDKYTVFRARSSSPILLRIRKQIDFEINQLEKARIIKDTSNTPYALPLLVVKKTNSKGFRLVLNLISGNKYTKYLSILFQSAEDVLMNLKG